MLWEWLKEGMFEAPYWEVANSRFIWRECITNSGQLKQAGLPTLERSEILSETDEQQKQYRQKDIVHRALQVGVLQRIIWLACHPHVWCLQWIDASQHCRTDLYTHTHVKPYEDNDRNDNWNQLWGDTSGDNTIS